MNVLIVEDETAAYENLVDILMEVAPDIQIAGNTESVTQTVHWLQSNPAPELIFMDIHLSDGSAFNIFDKIELETPIVFTTAYDRYAIEAWGGFVRCQKELHLHPNNRQHVEAK